MNDNDIIKALECCLFAYGKKCEECPYEKHKPFLSSTQFCTYSLKKDILDLINRQKAEIKKHQKLDELAEKTIDNQTLVIKELRSEVATLKESNINLQDLYQNQKEKVEKAKQKCIGVAKAPKTAKAEAIKEFAERLKVIYINYQITEYVHNENSCYVRNVGTDDIDNLVKEMVGEKE